MAKGTKPPRASRKNPKSHSAFGKNPNGHSNNNNNKRKPLGPTKSITKTKSKSEPRNAKNDGADEAITKEIEVLQPLSDSLHLNFFLNQYQSANGVQLSPLELDSIKDSCILELSENSYKEEETFKKDIKAAFGSSWREALCEGKILEGKVDPGSPSVLFISTSAIRAIELLRTVRSLTKECHAAKLFSKHIKVEEQVTMLKKRVNIASGTPNRLKKLVEIEAFGLSRLAVIVLDMHTDVKGYSLLSLPQVREEFWDLYKNYLHPRILQGDLRICLYGPIPASTAFKGKKKAAED